MSLPSCKNSNRLSWTLAKAVLLLCLSSLVSTGCVLTDRFKREPKPEGPPAGPVHQVVATWNNRVVVTPDAVNGGANLPGIVGRLYFFGPELGFPVSGDGTVSVALYDATQPGKSRLVEVWNIDKETLTRLCRKDRIGWGYTLFLPWKNYHPNLNKIEMVARYNPEKGYPMYAPKTKITLNPTDEHIMPVSHTVPAKDLSKTKANGGPPSNQHLLIPTPPGAGYQKFRIPMPQGRTRLENTPSFPPTLPAPLPPQAVAPQANRIISAEYTSAKLPMETKQPSRPQPTPPRTLPNINSAPIAQPQPLSPSGIRAARVTGTATRVVVPGSPQQVRKTLFGKFSDSPTTGNAPAPTQSQAAPNRLTVFPRPVKSSITPTHQSSVNVGAPTVSNAEQIDTTTQPSGGLYDPRPGNAVYPAQRP